MKNINSSPAAIYHVEPEQTDDDAVIRHALQILSERVNRGDALTSPQQTRQYLTLKLSSKEQEHFCALWLDNSHQPIEFETLSTGTIDGASVYPREVVRSAIKHNAAAVIFAHNHPSGTPEPSQADINITDRLKKALDLIEIRTLDHIVIGGDGSVSLAERGHF